MVDTGNETYYAAPRPLEKVIAVYDYEAQGDQELDIEEGVHIHTYIHTYVHAAMLGLWLYCRESVNLQPPVLLPR